MDMRQRIQQLILMQAEFDVAKTNPKTGKPSDWVSIKKALPELEQYTHRQQLENEIIIELDTSSMEESEKLYKQIRPKLAKNLQSWECWTTQSKSYHIHAFFNKQITDEQRLAWIESIFTPEEIKHFDENFWLCSARHLIAIGGQKHYKSGKEKTLIESIGTSTNKFPEGIKPKPKKTITMERPPAKKYTIDECPVMLKALKQKFKEGDRNKILAKNFMALNPTQAEIEALSKAQENLGVGEIRGWKNSVGFKGEFNCVEMKKYADNIGFGDLCKQCEEQKQSLQEWESQPATEIFTGEEFKDIFENTHRHLPLYDKIAASLGLKGGEYYALKKAVCYFDHSCQQQAKRINIGMAKSDNRLHLLILAGVGKGKGVIKTHIKRMRKTNVGDVIEVAGLIHPEQLIGKTVYTGKGADRHLEEREGYLRAKVLLSDECQKMINEEDSQWQDVQRIKRKAMDIYLDNEVEKKLIEQKLEDTLSYCPETRIIDFAHPTKLKGAFFDTGSFRRYLLLELAQSKQYDLNDSTSLMFTEPVNEETLKQELREQNNTTFDLKNTDEGRQEIADWVIAWNAWALTHDNPQIRRFAQTTFYSIKEIFIKMASILHRAIGYEKLDQQTTSLACFDTVHLLTETLKTIVKHGNPISTSEIWSGAEEEQIPLLEYLWRNNATSQDTSNIKIYTFEKFTGNVLGLNDRQARAKFAQLKKDGYIDSVKKPGISKVWITIEPVDPKTQMVISNPTSNQFERFDRNTLIKKLEKTKEAM